MARRCELTGKGTLVGNNVSHANNKTKRIYRPNLQTIDSGQRSPGQQLQAENRHEHAAFRGRNGGLDPFLLKAKDGVLSPKALRLKRAIAKKTAKQAA